MHTNEAEAREHGILKEIADGKKVFTLSSFQEWDAAGRRRYPEGTGRLG